MSDATIEELLAHRAWLANLVRGLVPDPGTADDVVQDTCLRALSRPPGHRRGLRGWLATVARNLVIDDQRRRTREERRNRGAAAERSVADTADVVARVETEREVARLVLDLPEPYRSTLLLRYWRGLSPAAIARETGTAAGTVRSRISRAHRMLRERLDRKHDGRRHAWVLTLLPLLDRKPVGGLAAMSMTAKVSAVLLLVAGVGVGFGSLVAETAPEPTPVASREPDPAPVAVSRTAPPADPFVKEEEPPPKTPGSNPLDESVAFSFADTPLAEALNFLGKVRGLTFEFEDVPDNIVISLDSKGIKVRAAIDLLTRLAGCRWEQRADGVIVVRRDPELTAPRPERQPKARPAPAIPEPSAPDPVYPAVPPAIDLASADMATPLPADVATRAVEIAVDRDGKRFLRLRPDGRFESPPTKFLFWLRLSDLFAAAPGEVAPPVLLRADRRAAARHIGDLPGLLKLLGRPVGDVWIAAKGLTSEPSGLRGFDPVPAPKDPMVRVRIETHEGSKADLDAGGLYRAFYPLLKAVDTRPITISFEACDMFAEFGSVVAVLNEATRFGFSIRAPGFRVLRHGDPVPKPGRFLVISRITSESEPPELRPGVALARRLNPDPIRAKHARQPFRDRAGHRNLRAHGGSAATFHAVNLGLRWLAGAQEPDGSWSSDRDEVATTSAALLAFLGAGETPTLGKWKSCVRKGVDWLIARLEVDGAVGEDALGHAAATMVLAEVYAQSIGAPEWRAPAQKAVDHLQARRPDLAAIHVLTIARLAGLRIDVERHTTAVRALDASTPLELAVGTFDRFLIGDTPDIAKVGPKLLHHAPSANGTGGMLLWLAATDALLRVGGEPWKEWNRKMKETLLPLQRDGRAEVGSFDPVGPVATDGGRVVSTALSVLCLESYYRYGGFKALR